MSAAQLSKAQVEGIRNVFQKFDRNGDGTINVSELGDVMRKLGRVLDERLLREKMALMDKNGSGKVDFDEFVDAVADVFVDPWTDPEIESAFRVFDKDHSGKISRDELIQVARVNGIKATDADLDAMLKAADLDGDGQVKYSEFYRIMKR